MPQRPAIFRPKTARIIAATALLAASLAGCTGTVESSPPARFVLLTGGGAALQTLTLTTDEESARPRPVAELGDAVEVVGGQSIAALEGGRSFALARSETLDGAGTVETGALEKRAPNLIVSTNFAAVPFAACWKAAVSEPAGETLLALSECEGGVQNVALFRADGSLLWWAALPAGGAPTDPDAAASDQPPVRLGLIDRVGVVARPALGGGSELMRVAAGAGTADGAEAEVTAPVSTLAVRDLATYRVGNAATIYAATDGGVFALTAAGVPDANPLPTFGTGRYDRVWATDAAVRGAPLLLAYAGDDSLSTTRRYDLRFWKGDTNAAADSAPVIDELADVQDIALSGGYLYVLTGRSLTRYDALLGLAQERWAGESLGVSVDDGRELVQVAVAAE